MKNTAVLIGCLAVLGFTDVAIATPAVPERVELAQAPRPLVSGERVRVKKLARDMESAMQTLNQGGVTPLPGSDLCRQVAQVGRAVPGRSTKISAS